MSSLDLITAYTPTPNYETPDGERYRAGVLARGIREALAIIGSEEISVYDLVEGYNVATLEAAATALEQGREVSFTHGRRRTAQATDDPRSLAAPASAAD